ncbi:MAG TPA: 50S ribosomal protein L21 [Fimbriimonas sp.]|nr:50S ribosomal protein L21 [Fimbriimonas sp.]
MFASIGRWKDFMYAIVKTGGKQYKAEKDGVLIVDKLPGEPGAAVEFTEVLLVVDGEKSNVGSSLVKGAVVKGEIVRQAKDKKINAFNYKPKKNERKRWGHRQQLTHVRITEVVAGK